MIIKKDLFKFLLGILLAGAILGWIFRDTDGRELWAQLRNASVTGLLAAAALNIVHNVFRVLRWKVLLEPVRKGIPFRPMFAAVILGYATSWVIPGRLGELVRPMLLSARERLPLGPCIGSVVADRLLDAMTVVALFAVGLWITPLTGQVAEYTQLIRGTGLLMVAGIAGIIGTMLALSVFREPLSRWIEKRSGMVRWVGRIALEVAQGAHALRSPRLVVLIVLYSVMVWLTITLSTWVGVRSVGAEISFGAMLIVMPMLVLGVAVPTPGGAGSYHGAMTFGLTSFGVLKVTALSAGLMMHLAATVPIVLLGLVLLWTEKISGKDLVSSAREFRNLGGSDDTTSNGAAMESLP